MPRTTDRPERLYLRVTGPLRTVLEEVAAEDGRTLSDLSRKILLDFAANYLARRDFATKRPAKRARAAA
jgi:hypothetical protein